MDKMVLGSGSTGRGVLVTKRKVGMNGKEQKNVQRKNHFRFS